MWVLSLTIRRVCRLQFLLAVLVRSRYGLRRKHRLHYCYVLAVETWLFGEPLLNNGCYIVAYFAVVAYQRVHMSEYF
jgi:hypothetical protein